MAITINRVLGDGGRSTTIEFCSTGNAAGETGTLIDLSTLIDAPALPIIGEARVVGIEALVAGNNAGVLGGFCELKWSGSGDVFCRIPIGQTSTMVTFDPTTGFTGSIEYELTPDVSVTLRLRLDKTRGFKNTTASF